MVVTSYAESHIEFAQGISNVIPVVHIARKQRIMSYNDGRLVGIASKNDLIPEGNSYHSFNVSSDAGYDSIKLFVWDSLSGMKPLYKVYDF